MEYEKKQITMDYGEYLEMENKLRETQKTLDKIYECISIEKEIIGCDPFGAISRKFVRIDEEKVKQYFCLNGISIKRSEK